MNEFSQERYDLEVIHCYKLLKMLDLEPDDYGYYQNSLDFAYFDLTLAESQHLLKMTKIDKNLKLMLMQNSILQVTPNLGEFGQKKTCFVTLILKKSCIKMINSHLERLVYFKSVGYSF
eukprot:TRINITY_DN12219_c0_g1_i1.p1 TRINITY_DN12219_c0_g1~~TRINITY_DN12219_c0_g1_i1.p1  ORF type:complete len:119 (-),score=25.31 TRINITY_DN12219_c0_g1_i1:75-431(-)